MSGDDTSGAASGGARVARADSTTGSGASASRRRIGAEVLIVLGLSLGASAAYSIVRIIDLTTRAQRLSDTTTSLNPPASDRPTFDLIYQLMGVFFDLVPVALVAFLLWSVTRPHLGRLGIDFKRPGRDVGPRRPLT